MATYKAREAKRKREAQRGRKWPSHTRSDYSDSDVRHLHLGILDVGMIRIILDDFVRATLDSATPPSISNQIAVIQVQDIIAKLEG